MTKPLGITIEASTDSAELIYVTSVGEQVGALCVCCYVCVVTCVFVRVCGVCIYVFFTRAPWITELLFVVASLSFFLFLF